MRADSAGGCWHILAGGIIGGVASFAATLLTGGSLAEAGISAIAGAASGALTAAFPGAAVLIDAGFSFAEELAINYIKNEPISKKTMTDATCSAAVDTVSSITANESRLTKNVMDEFVDAIPKTFKGNHPNVKTPAQKVVRRTGKAILKESGETVAEKTFGNIVKNILKSIF